MDWGNTLFLVSGSQSGRGYILVGQCREWRKNKAFQAEKLASAMSRMTGRKVEAPKTTFPEYKLRYRPERI